MSRDEAPKFELPSCPGCGRPRGQRVLEAPDRFHGRRQTYRLVRCSHCSLVWTQNPPHPSAAGEHYGTRYDQSVTWAGEDPERWRGRCDVLRSYKPQPGAILDLGCSAGGFLTCVKRMGWRCYGIEMSTAAANLARSRAEAEVFVGDILDAPYAPETFDAITCFHVLEHIYQPRDVLAKISGWLKPGGVFYSMVPNIESAGAKLFGSYWYALELPRHICHFSPRSFALLGRSAGLEPALVETHREVFIEHSARYILDSLFERAGIVQTPLSDAKAPGIPFRIARKAFRLTVLPILTAMASLAGDGESIHAIFRKPVVTEDGPRRRDAVFSAAQFANHRD